MDYLFIGIKEIVQILENPPEKCITIPPRKPKAGQVFLFRGEDPTKEEDWRCDQYRWDNQGVARLPRKDLKVRKMYFNADTPTGSSKEFQRHAYQLLDNKSLTLVHYIGDETAAKNFSHRGAKRYPDKPFIRTCPSYMKTCEEMCKNEKANVVYKKEVASMQCKPEHVAVQTPRNMQQLRNLRQKQLHQSRISKDDLYNLHEIAYDVPGFVWKITTYPDLTCVCGLREILEEAAEKVLPLKATSGTQLLSYDTTFQLGDFYVSPLIFRHTVFRERPCIPAMFLIHERKLKETHQEMFVESTKQIHPDAFGVPHYVTVWLCATCKKAQ